MYVTYIYLEILPFCFLTFSVVVFRLAPVLGEEEVFLFLDGTSIRSGLVVLLLSLSLWSDIESSLCLLHRSPRRKGFVESLEVRVVYNIITLIRWRRVEIKLKKEKRREIKRRKFEVRTKMKPKHLGGSFCS